VFWGFRIWLENGIMERWKIGLPKDNCHFNFIVNPADGGTTDPT
jgi:hypothetical protein